MHDTTTHGSGTRHSRHTVLPTILRILALAWVVQASCGAMLCGVEDDPEQGEAQVCVVLDEAEEEEGWHAGSWYYDPEYECWAFLGARRSMGGVLVGAEECARDSVLHRGNVDEVRPRVGWWEACLRWAEALPFGITHK